MMRKIMVLLFAAALLCGCGRMEDPYRVDTVVWIPVDPTRVTEEIAESEPAEEVTEIPETEAVTQPTEITEPTEEKKPASSGRKPSGGNAASKKPGTETKPTQTEPPETEAPETEPEETAPELYDISGYSLGSLEYAMADAINEARENEGLAPLGLGGRLSAIASCRANEIVQVWSHTRPDGRHYSSVLSDYGYGAGSVTELLVYVTGNGDAASVVGKWLESDSHRQSILSGGYTAIGIGTFRTNGYTYICCLLVG